MGGVAEWSDFMQAVHVIKWAPGEPHKEVPLWLVRDSLLSVNVNIFWEVQVAVAMLILLFTFARTESPCPAAHTGDNAFTPRKHLQVNRRTCGLLGAAGRMCA